MNTSSVYTTRKLRWLAVVSILIIIFVASCVPQEPIDESEVIDCTNIEASDYSCVDPDDQEHHEIRVNNVVDGYSPGLLRISDQRRQQLLEAKKVDTTCIFAIVGDLVFRRDGKVDPNPQFSSTVSILFTFSDTEMKAFEGCQTEVMASLQVDTVDWWPIYFRDDQWQPFTDDEFTPEAPNSVILTVKSWGDQPIGGGSQP